MSDRQGMTATVECHNAFRYRAYPRWFDFWNARVLIPDEGLFFYTMPYILSGVEVSSRHRGLYVFDGGNGGNGEQCDYGRTKVDNTNWRASDQSCDLAWVAPDGSENRFSASRIKVSGLTTSWDVHVLPRMARSTGDVPDERRLRVLEKLMLSRSPFIHWVPQIVGRASGTIEQNERVHQFDNVPFYQAKNHGTGFPASWRWLHCGSFPGATDFGFEMGSLLSVHDQELNLARLEVDGHVRTFGSWMGDDIEIRADGSLYSFRLVARDGTTEIEGTGRLGPVVTMRFPTPDGTVFENMECLLSTMRVIFDAKELTTETAAIGEGRLIPSVPIHG